MIRVMTEKGLSGNALKVIAIVAMTIDHLAWVGIETYEQWAKAVGLWTECVEESLPKSLGEQIAEGGEAVVYDHGSTLIKSILF